MTLSVAGSTAAAFRSWHEDFLVKGCDRAADNLARISVELYVERMCFITPGLKLAKAPARREVAASFKTRG